MLRTPSIILLSLLMSISLATAGGVPESELQQPSKSWQNETTKESPELEKALQEAREPYASPTPRSTQAQPIPVAKPAPQPIPQPYNQNGWLLKSNGTCSSLDSLTQQVGSFKTPQEYARKMQQRGHQAFVLDLGDGQIKVKVPDQNQSLLFVEAVNCR